MQYQPPPPEPELPWWGQALIAFVLCVMAMGLFILMLR